MKYLNLKTQNKKSVRSINPFESVILTFCDIVKAHGGSITINSELKDGAGFIINLNI